MVDPRTISRVEREGSVTRLRAGVGGDLLVVESPDEVMIKIEANTIRPREAPVPPPG